MVEQSRMPPPQAAAVPQARQAPPAYQQPAVQFRRLDRYSGSVDYNLYRAQFMDHAMCMGWDEQTMGLQLAQALSDKALEALRFLPEHTRRNFRALDAELKRRFGLRVDENACRAQLRKMEQSSQSLDQFATLVSDCVRGAYPGMPEAHLQREMVQIFVAGLRDVTTAQFLVRENHYTLDAALNSARLQPPQIALQSSHRTRAVHAAVLGEDEEITLDIPAERGPKAQKTKVDAIVASLNAVSEKMQDISSNQHKLLENHGKRDDRVERDTRDVQDSRRDHRDRRDSRRHEQRGEKDKRGGQYQPYNRDQRQGHGRNNGRFQRNGGATRDTICYRCGRTGHFKIHCRVSDRDLLKRAQGETKPSTSVNVAATRPPTINYYCAPQAASLPPAQATPQAAGSEGLPTPVDKKGNF
jgi:hypothetical protein